MRPARYSAIVFLALLTTGCGDPAVPASECLIDYASDKAGEMAAIERGMVVMQRIAQREATTDTLFDHERETLRRAQAILTDRTRPVDALDVSLLDGALALLDDPARWDRADDRVCEDGDETFSLYCALYFASLDYLGEYEHRRTAIQEVRFAIEDATDGREFEHRLMDYNNDPDTSLADVRGVIRTARERVAFRLAKQAECSIEY